jgi:hypothetical protein
MVRRKLCDIGKMIDVEMIETKGGGKEGKISGRIIEHAGEQTGAPIKAGVDGEVEISRVDFDVIEHLESWCQRCREKSKRLR